MTTTASKLFLGGAVAALLSAWIYGWGTGGGLTGVMLFGLLGGVGELSGYTVLVAASLVMATIGTTTSLLRDADPEAQAAAARLEVAPPVTVPAGPTYWPVLGGLCVVVAIVGVVASPVLFVIGVLGVLLVTLEWMVSAWSERATGDPEINRQIRNRLMYPIEIPVAGALVILVLVVSISRVLLSLDRNTSSAIAVGIGASILAGAFLVAYRPKLSKDAIAVLLAFGAVVLIGAGIVSASAGPRDFEHHTDDGAGAEGGEHGSAPITIDRSESESAS